MNSFRKNLPLNQRSQIAVIITFVIAVVILFIAVFINISKVSQVKTTTSTAADRTALSLASQLGSMSHYYKEKTLKGQGTETEIYGKKVIQACDTQWLPLVLLIITAVITGVASFFFPPALYVGAAIGAISMAMLGGISAKFQEMSGYNALREAALFQSLLSTQSDDVEFKAKTAGTGIFYDDINGNGVFDEGTDETYNLSAIPEMHNEKKVSRFLAWYYTKRFPLVSDDLIRSSLNTFIDRVRDFIDADGTDPNTWRISKISYVIKQLPAHDYEITCNLPSQDNPHPPNQCPDWVKDKAANTPYVQYDQLRIIRMDASDDVSGGFLQDKLNSSPPIGLLRRLEAAYDLSFCNASGCQDVDNLIEDLRMFLSRSKAVLNLPVSKRLNDLTQWFPLWYDFKRHDQADMDNDLDKREPIPVDPPDPNKYTYDIYLRLMRDKNFISTMITELETLNSDKIAGPMPTPDPPIPGTIPAPNGHNEYGLGVMASQCNTNDCCCSDCVCDCCDPGDCSFQGIYCSAWGGSRPPVCVNGDLYGTIPPGCPLTEHPDPCVCEGCDHAPQQTDACNFQGQLVYATPAGPTEVEQAIRILRALNDDLARIQATIAALADAIERQLPSRLSEPHTDTNNNGVIDQGEFTDLNGNGIYDAYLFPEFLKRTAIVYAWKDKPKPNGGEQFSHLVKVKIDGYPENLPNVTESKRWLGLQKCRQLNDYQGEFTITTWRYDQDQPTDIAEWKLRRRKTEKPDEFDKTKLEAMVGDIQNCGILNNPCVMPPQGCTLSGVYTDADVDDLLNNYAITSYSKAHYGPIKSDIKIIKTEGD